MMAEEAIREAAYACLLEQKWRALPVEPAKFSLERWDILSFQEYARLAGLSEEAVTASFFERDGYTVRGLRENRLLLLYNEKVSAQRLRFTVAHELGHFFVPAFWGEGEPKSWEEYCAREQAADAFAAYLLMPDALLWAMKDRGFPLHPAAVSRRFGVSAAAARRKLLSFGTAGRPRAPADGRIEALFADALRRVSEENRDGETREAWEEERAAFLARHDKMLEPE